MSYHEVHTQKHSTIELTEGAASSGGERVIFITLLMNLLILLQSQMAAE